MIEPASPLPWRYENGREIVCDVLRPTPKKPKRMVQECVVCFGHDYDDYGSVGSADAEYIIEAVNNYAELRTRCDRYETALRRVEEVLAELDDCIPDVSQTETDEVAYGISVKLHRALTGASKEDSGG